jgi:hypothetical protein
VQDRRDPDSCSAVVASIVRRIRISCDGVLLLGMNDRTLLSNVISPAASCWCSTTYDRAAATNWA